MADPMPPAQDLRVLTARLGAIEAELRALSAPTGTQQTQVVRRLKETAEAIPETHIISNSSTGGAMPTSTGWTTVTSAQLTAPAGKTRVSINAMAMANYRMPLPSGAWTPPLLTARVVVQGLAQGEALATEAYSDQDSYTYIDWQATTSGAIDAPVTEGDTVLVQLQLRRQGSTSSYPSYSRNYADLAATVTFSGVIGG